MKKTIRMILILLAVFVGSVILFSTQINNKTTIISVPAENPTLPIVYMEVNETAVNEMFGVRSVLEEEMLRDSITPLPSDKTLRIQVDPGEYEIAGISYQLSLPSSAELVENGQVTGIETAGDRLTADFAINANIRNSQEYTLRIALDVGSEQPVYYYTRLVQGSGIDLRSYFTFAQDFAIACMDKMTVNQVINYLETDETAANRSYTDVNIHSSTDMISWGNLAPEMVKEATPRIRELNTTTASVELEYLISAEDSNGETEYYRVTDFYRMRYSETNNSVSLLNFERSAELIFDARASIQTSTGLDLGVQDRNLEYKANRDNDIVAFVVGGDLWTYRQNNGQASRVFSFRDADQSEDLLDDRIEWTDHDIRIEDVSDNGDVVFVVYGYMASGIHEGENGVSVCRYQASENAVQEQIFIPLAQSFPYLSENIERLSYVSEDNELYLFLGTELCSIDLNNGSYDIIQDNLLPDGFSASESQKTVAWVTGDDLSTASKVTVQDLTTGRSVSINAPENETILTCGFVNEDYVYGLVREGDAVTDATGYTTYGMYRLCIQGMDGELKKDYIPDGQYVTNVVQESRGLEITLSERTGSTYTTVATDHIMSNGEASETVEIAPTVYERTGEKILLNFPEAATLPDLKSVTSSILYTTAGAETVLEWPEMPADNYYVYGEGALIGKYKYANQALHRANDVSGVVLNANQQYVWVRGDWGTSYTIDTQALPEGLLNATFDEVALRELLAEDYTVINLDGCTQESLKYMLYKGYAVLARASEKETYLILGYDNYNIWIYDESTGGTKAIASDDSAALFERQGNQFLSYMAK